MATKIHVSALSTYNDCPRMYRYRYVELLAPKRQSPKLFFGTGLHQGLAEFYRTNNVASAIGAYTKWLDEQVTKLTNLEDTKVAIESQKLGVPLLNAYIDYAIQHDNFIATHVETKFEVPVHGLTTAGEVLHAGTFDGAVQDIHGRRWLMEHKTARDFPSPLSLRLNLQAKLYLLAAYQLFDTPVAGILYNVIRKVDPKRAKTPIIGRWYVTLPDYALNQAKNQLARNVDQMLADTCYDPRPGFHCGWKCAYCSLCEAEEDGIGYEDLVEQSYTIQEPENEKEEN